MQSRSFKEIQWNNLGEQAMELILQAILEGRLAPGDRLIEREIAEQMGVSRGPVREALQELETLGIVKRVPRKGTRLATWSASDVSDMILLRAMLEGLAARLASERAREDELIQLRALLGDLREAATAHDVSRTMEEDFRFHAAVAQASKHAGIIRALHQIRLQIRMLMAMDTVLCPPASRLESTVSVHELILDAIQRRDADLAERTMNQHIREIGDGLIQQMRNQSKLVNAPNEHTRR